MNIVQIHNKVAFYLDAERSPRFKDPQVDKSINSAIMDIVNTRYSGAKSSQKDKGGFQISQRIRDELYTLVRYSGPILADGDRIPAASYPTDYMFLILLEVNISNKTINTIPITYDEYNMVHLNPYFRPSIVWPERVYRIESEVGTKIVFGDVGRLISANMHYIAKPAKANIGTEVNTTNYNMYSGTEMIAYFPTRLNRYDSNWTLIDTITLAEEEEYTVGTAGESGCRLASGIVYINFTNTDLPEVLHDEICRNAAKILSGNVENYNREQSLEKDIDK